jgi:uncharacterized LabA/DUF88 family protein
VSKNVAVFVDVANIFYAAKAAGVDIDYVTLLKSATAGRDFVRAYAYTGLDPDNDNQRQFHQFLARHDYKVVSKDIRKYGDGKVKANLDIELVVDLMKTARNLDIAVVVSGDGDFAPAIRAVQEMGVRVEVISFRGNTSSDLMDVADVFTDITQIARVEKESSRSGRRVAAEDDLSMTAVPDKESEGAPRRRRTTRARPEREEPAVAAEPRRGGRRAPVAEAAPVALASTGAVVALPGERLSRAASRPAVAPEAEVEGREPEIESDDEPVAAGGRVGEVDAEGAPRRRRRRGGRGRGRGRGERPVAGEQPLTEAGEVVEEEIVEYSAPRAPQPSAFGSIWDSQLGVPSTPVLAGEQLDDVPDDEPEIPEYLLAERRQQRGAPPRAGGRGGRGRGGAYQVALDRERFGRSGAPSGGGTGNFNTGPRPSRAPVPRGPRPDRPRQDRPPRQYTEAPRRESDGSPWSEVPPELEAQLRAELARRPARDAAPAVVRSEPAPSAEPAAKAATPAPRRPRAPRKTGDEVPTAVASAASASEVAAKPRRTRTTAKKVEDAAPPVQADEPAKPRRTRAPRKAAPEA